MPGFQRQRETTVLPGILFWLVRFSYGCYPENIRWCRISVYVLLWIIYKDSFLVILYIEENRFFFFFNNFLVGSIYLVRWSHHLDFPCVRVPTVHKPANPQSAPPPCGLRSRGMGMGMEVLDLPLFFIYLSRGWVGNLVLLFPSWDITKTDNGEEQGKCHI